MLRLPTRQVHLDFHTSELIEGVGKRFSKENFQNALKTGNINSITVFAKCHHSWCYYPSKVGQMHPSLDYDLTGAMIAAANEIGVRAPVYITVGWSSNDAEAHPEWVVRNREGAMVMSNGSTDANPDDKRPIVSWKFLCINSGYQDVVYAHAREICERYQNLDGLFFDCCYIERPCFCPACIKGMKKEGLDPHKDEDEEKFRNMIWHRFSEECTRILREKHKEATLFFNGGAFVNRPMWHDYQTHYEMEDLPTTWGGYDKMPQRALYFARYGKDYIGMTGKFHTTWGEFGGFKTADALRYECAAMMSYGAKCSVGDQMHPSGEMDLESYRIIGEAYRYAEKIEEYCFDAESSTKLGIMLSGKQKSDEGLVKMLLERKMDFNIVLPGDDPEMFDTIILPDEVRLDECTASRLNSFVENGGSILLTGTSGLDMQGKKFMINAGIEYIGPSEYDIVYVKPGDELSYGIVKSPFLFYESAQRVSLKEDSGAVVLGKVYEPYFIRTYGHYCSHQNTPYKTEPAQYPAAVLKGRVVYIAHRICKQYFEIGAQFHRDYFINALNLIYKNPIMKVSMLPSAGRARFLRQKGMKRYVLHLLYASPIQRGRALVVEDLPTIYRVPVELRIPEKVNRVYLAPQEQDIPFVQIGGKVIFEVPEVNCHQIAVITY